MTISRIAESQNRFLKEGGFYGPGLRDMYDKGIFPEEYLFRPYPKHLNLTLGFRDFDMQTETCKGQTIRWTESREVIVPMTVHSEDHEDAVRAAFNRALELGLPIQPEWTADILLHAVKVAETPKRNPNLPRPTPEQIVADRIAKLKAELAALEPVEANAELPDGATPIAAASPASPAPARRRATSGPLPIVAPDPVA